MAAYVENDELIIDYQNKTNLMTIHELALKAVTTPTTQWQQPLQVKFLISARR